MKNSESGLTEVNPTLEKIRKIHMDHIQFLQNHPNMTKEEQLSAKNNAAIKKWRVLQDIGMIVSEWKPF